MAEMCKKFLFITLLAVFLLLNANPGFAEFKREDIFIAASIETAPYNFDTLAFGTGLTFGYGTGAAIGLKLSCFFDTEGMNALELNFLMKYFFKGFKVNNGLFFQLMTGLVIFNRIDDFSFDTNKGSVTYGLGLGWRFLFGDKWYLEPMVRGGYPYIYSVGISGGIRL
ncbi:MAG: hypothetical protein FWD47_11320 [Treponema sp.]|nr:hypothetical protein [Treponema sp.]